jgi:hypothetical protein
MVVFHFQGVPGGRGGGGSGLQSSIFLIQILLKHKYKICGNRNIKFRGHQTQAVINLAKMFFLST